MFYKSESSELVHLITLLTYTPFPASHIKKLALQQKSLSDLAKKFCFLKIKSLTLAGPMLLNLPDRMVGFFIHYDKESQLFCTTRTGVK